MKRVLPIVGFTVLAFVAIFWRSDAFAQDETITNADQLAAVIDQSGLWYPLVNPTEQSLSNQALRVFWADFSQLTNAIGDVRNFEGVTQYGVTVWRLRLTRTADQMVFSYPAADTNLFQLAVTEDGFSNHYDRVLWSWCILTEPMNSESYDDLLADGDTFLDPKRIVLDIWVGDINDCDTYNDNATGSEMFTTMSGESDDLTPDFGIDGDPCSVTNLMQPFQVVSIDMDTNRYTAITWESCPRFLYGVFSADALNTNLAAVAWQPRAYLWGWPNTTTWTDITTSNSSVSNRFYRVERLPPGGLIAAGGYHSLALRDDLLWAWGADGNGQLGDGAIYDVLSPEPIGDPRCGAETISNVVVIAAGDHYSAAVDANGVVWTWGANTSGQLGNGGGTTNILTPSPISGISNVVSVAAGNTHTLALRGDGTVWAWGDNSSGELGTGSLSPSSTNFPIRSSMILSQVVAIAAGNAYSMALQANGSVLTWGDNENGQLGNGSSDGSGHPVPMVVSNLPSIIAIAAGGDQTVALASDQTLWTWGGNYVGELGRTNAFIDGKPGHVNGLSNVVAIAAGYEVTLAVTSNGQVYAWGDNTFGELGTNSTDVASANFPMVVPGISNAVVVSANSGDNSGGGEQSLAVTVAQGLLEYWGWGSDSNGQVGNGTNVYLGVQDSPAQIQFFQGCVSCIQLGTNGSFTASTSGTLFLYFNDDKGDFEDNSGSFTATITGLGSVTVMANNSGGVAIGTVTNGGLYTYAASGVCTNCFTPGNCGNDPNGADPNTGILRSCSTNITVNFICPDKQCYSLVGKIE